MALDVVLSALGGGGIAGAIVTYFLNRKLESIKASQHETLEKLRNKLGLLNTRLSFAFQKEHETIAECWGLMHEAYGSVLAIAPMLDRHPDFRNMADDQSEEFVMNQDWPEFTKKAFRETEDRESFYLATRLRMRIHQARQDVNSWHNFMIRKRLYLKSEILARSNDLHAELIRAIVNQESVSRYPREVPTRPYEMAMEAAPLIVEDIEILMKRRLYPEED